MRGRRTGSRPGSRARGVPCFPLQAHMHTTRVPLQRSHLRPPPQVHGQRDARHQSRQAAYAAAAGLGGAAASLDGQVSGMGGGGAARALTVSFKASPISGACVHGEVVSRAAGPALVVAPGICPGPSSPPNRLAAGPPPLCSIGGEAEKRRLLLEQLDAAGQQQLMRGRVRWAGCCVCRLGAEGRRAGQGLGLALCKARAMSRCLG